MYSIHIIWVLSNIFYIKFLLIQIYKTPFALSTRPFLYSSIPPFFQYIIRTRYRARTSINYSWRMYKLHFLDYRFYGFSGSSLNLSVDERQENECENFCGFSARIFIRSFFSPVARIFHFIFPKTIAGKTEVFRRWKAKRANDPRKSGYGTYQFLRSVYSIEYAMGVDLSKRFSFRFLIQWCICWRYRRSLDWKKVEITRFFQVPLFQKRKNYIVYVKMIH